MHESRSRSSRSLIRVFLFAEHQIVLDTLEHFINAARDISVTTATREIDSASDENLTEICDGADVGVIYVSNPDQLRLVSVLLSHNPSLRVVVAVYSSDLDAQANALKHGAVGIVHSNKNVKFLLEAIRQTYRGETWLNQALLHKILDRGETGRKRPQQWVESGGDSLTTRELEVVALIGEGFSNKAVATALNISEATVRHHLSSIYAKIGVEDRVNMIIFAYRNRLINFPSD